ncbi:hypothetical protein, partial [Oceaniferula flava]|uniref:hypothetical protein n=1 Tax=Oceaniferula flava TaxID=2800421 RepID=UPI002867EC08
FGAAGGTYSKIVSGQYLLATKSHFFDNKATTHCFTRVPRIHFFEPPRGNGGELRLSIQLRCSFVSFWSFGMPFKHSLLRGQLPYELLSLTPTLADSVPLID